MKIFRFVDIALNIVMLPLNVGGILLND